MDFYCIEETGQEVISLSEGQRPNIAAATEMEEEGMRREKERARKRQRERGRLGKHWFCGNAKAFTRTESWV